MEQCITRVREAFNCSFRSEWIINCSICAERIS